MRPFKNGVTEQDITNMVLHTDLRIKEWYSQVLEDYCVKGAGHTHYNKKDNEIVVEYTEDGVQRTWSMAFYPEYLKNNGANWVFNCWSELANKG